MSVVTASEQSDGHRRLFSLKHGNAPGSISGAQPRGYGFSPHFLRGFCNQAQLGFLVSGSHKVAFNRRGEAALRTECQPFQRDNLRCLLDSLLQFVLIFEGWFLRADQPQNNGPVFGHLAQGLESTRAFIVVFKEEPMKLRPLKYSRDGTVVPGGVKPTLIVAPAQVETENHTRMLSDDGIVHFR